MSTETAFSRYQSTKYFTALDGLRALSAALVVAWHTRNSPLAFLQGERGVTVFFVLSGFLITMLALREEDRDGSLSIRDFFMRRVFRILPLYYVVLAGYFLLANLFDGDKAAGFNESLPWYIFYFSEVPLLLNEIEAPFNHSWSLGIEEKFYFVWPFLAFSLFAKSKLRLPLALAAGSLLLFAGFLRPGHGSWVSLIEPYGHILVGTALAFALHHEWSFNALGFLRKPATYWGLGLVCVVVGVIDSPWAFEFLAYPTALFVGSMVLQPAHPISRAFSTKPLVLLGTLSYAVYLIHPAVLAVFERIIPDSGRIDDLTTMVLGYGASALIGLLLHRTIEQPFIKLGRRFTKPRAKDAPVAEPAGNDDDVLVRAETNQTESPPTDDAGGAKDQNPPAGPSDTGSGGRGFGDDDIIDLTDQSGAPTSVAAAGSTGVVAMSAAGLVASAAVAAGRTSGSDDLAIEADASSSAGVAASPDGQLLWGSDHWVMARGTSTVTPGNAPRAPRRSLQFGMFADPVAQRDHASADASAGDTDQIADLAVEESGDVPDLPASSAPAEADETTEGLDEVEQELVEADETLETVETVDLAEPVDPVEPVEDLAPVEPVEPVEDLEPVEPARAVEPRPADDLAGRGPAYRSWTLVALGLLGLLGLGFAAAVVFSDDADAPVVAPLRVDEVAVDGKQLVMNGDPIRLHAVTQFGPEYSCVGGWGIFDSQNAPDTVPAFAEWGINAVRVPLNEHCWLGVNGVDPAYGGPAYQQAIVDYVDLLRSEGVVVILTLGWSGPGDQMATNPGVLANVEHSVPFWQSVATEVADRSGVMFDLFVTPVATSADCYVDGCENEGVAYAGTQTLVDAIRQTGSSLPIVVSMPKAVEDGVAVDLRLPNDPLNQLIVGTRGRYSADCPTSGCWTAELTGPAAQVPILATAAARSCEESDTGPAAAGIAELLDQGVSVVVPGWNPWDPCSVTPVLIDGAGQPTEFGQLIQEVFTRG